MVNRKRQAISPGTFAEPTVASILGLSGPVRFRLHGSGQKAHLVLRRVQVAEGSNDDGKGILGAPKTAFYSLFAHKRIEVKPGKEILLAVEGEFEDRPILIGGDILGSSLISGVQSVLRDNREAGTRLDDKMQVEVTAVPDDDEKEQEIITMPPKMRKSWMRGRQSLPSPDVHTSRQLSPMREDVGVQAQPEYASVLVETIPAPILSLTTQTVNEDPPGMSGFAEENIPGLHAHMDQSYDPHLSTAEPDREDSLSAMEMSPSPERPTVKPVQISPSYIGALLLKKDTVAPNRPISPSSSASSAPDELDIKLITDPSLLPTASSSSFLTPNPPQSSSPISSNKSLPSSRGASLLISKTISMGASASSFPSSSKVTVEQQSPPLPGLQAREQKSHPIWDAAVPPWANNPLPAHLRKVTPPVQTKTETHVPDIYLSRRKSGTDSHSWGTPPPESPGGWGNSVATEGWGEDPVVEPPPVQTKIENQVPDMYLSRGKSGTDLHSWGTPPLKSPGGWGDSMAGGRGNTTSSWGTPPLESTGGWGDSTGGGWGTATSSWGTPPLDASGGWGDAPGGRGSAGSSWLPPRSAASGSNRVQPPDREVSNASATKPKPPDVHSLLSLASGPTDNPLGIRPSSVPNKPVVPVPIPPRPSSGSTQPEHKKSVVIGSHWPPKLKSSVSANGSSKHSSAASKTPEDAENTSMKWKRIGADSVPVKLEPESDPVVPRAAPTNIPTNGKSFRPPPNFVGYTPPMKQIPPPAALAPISAPPPRSHSSISRGTKRSASEEVNTPSELNSPAPSSSSKRSLKWPVHMPMYTAQMKLEGKDPAIRSITFNSDGSQFAVCCHDHSVRIWNNQARVEVAKLAHVAPVISVAWMDGDMGVVSLGETGEVSKWTRVGGNQWHWAKLLEASSEHRPGSEPTSFAYMRDRIAIAFPRVGVKVWLWVKGMWQPQRSILRQNVTTIKFIEEGEALLGGTADGVLWYCQIPSGTLRAYSFFKSGVSLLDVNATGNQLLVTRSGGFAHLVSFSDDRKGKTEREYSLKQEAPGATEHGAVFTNTENQIVAFGTAEGCLLLWEKNKVVGALEHGEDAAVQAVANFEIGREAREGHLITGTKSGVLSWWENSMATGDSNKRVRTQ